MSDSFVTQCPHCGTTFKVTSVHLNAANGSVRCGACLKIFSAKNHLVSESKIAAAKNSSIDKRTPGNSQHPQQGTGIHQVIKNDEPKDTFSAIDDEDDFVFEDDPDADSFPEEYVAKKDDEFSFGEMSDEVGKLTTSSQFSDPNVYEEEPTGNSDDEGWAMDMLEDMESEGKQDLNKISQKTLSLKEHDLFEDIKTDYLDGTVATDVKVPKVDQKLYDQIEAGPLELNFDQKNNNPKIWGWFLLSLLMLAILAGQIAWFNMDSWSRLDKFRPWYQQACNIVGCELKSQVEVSKIRTGNLILRTDINNPSELIVDAILINQARFEQPFAQIILEFSDINGKLIADGVFQPQQYLSGEMTGAILMPSRIPIHISFSVKNPGEKAVNYNLRYK